MKKLIYLSITFIALIILILAGIFIYKNTHQPAYWSCSPDEPRGSRGTKWENMINPMKPSIHLDANFVNDFTIGSDLASFIVKYQERQQPDNPFAVEVAELTPDGTVNIGGGTLKFASAGTAYYDANDSMDLYTDLHFYDEKFQKMSEERMKNELGIYNVTESKSSFSSTSFPAAQFIFKCEGIEDAILYSIDVFDGRTHSPLGTGGSSYGGSKFFRFSTHVTLWHRAPVDVVVEVAYGPSKTYEFAPKDGEGFKDENFECRLLHVFEGVDAHASSSESNGVTVKEIISKDTTAEPGLCFFFVCQPQAHMMPVTFEFLDIDGKLVRTQSSSTSSVTQRISIDEPPGKVTLIRARYRTKRQRIILHLPYIPGLPEQNNDIKNLFDVYVPYATIISSYQLDRFVRGTLQLSSSSSTSFMPLNNYSNANYPMDFAGVTVRDIAKFYSTGGTLDVDVKNDRLELKYPEPLKLRIEKFLRKILQKQPVQ